MKTIRVAVHLVDGGLREWTEGTELLEKLRSLQSEGFVGKELIHELFTDDWGVPPLSIEISGKASDGRNVSVVIPYT